MNIKSIFIHFFHCHFRDFVPAFVLSSILFFMAPLSIYQANKNILEFSLGDAWQFYFPLTLLSFFVLSLLIMFTRRWTSYLPIFFLTLSVCFLVQGNFLFNDIGKLDGHVILWDTFNKSLFQGVIIWVSIIGASIIFRKALYKNLLFISTLLISVGGAYVLLTITPVIRYQPQSSAKLYYDKSKEFEFSSDKNVIIIVLDTFRSDAFEYIINSDPKYKEDFKDFTFFSNAASGFPSTKPSIPLVLTGAFDDNTQKFNEYISSVKNQSLPYFLNKNGWGTEGYFFAGDFPASWNNLSTQIPFEHLASLIEKQYIVTFIRYMPLPLKKTFVDQYYYGNSYIHKNIVDFYKGANKTTKRNKQPVFKFIHLSGVHPPFELDAEFNEVDKGYIEQGKASLSAVSNLIQNMKKADVYANSLIIILGDHGTNRTMSFEVKQPGSFSDPNLSVMPYGVIYSANPLLLVKDFQQKQNSLSISEKPVSLVDIPKTIADAIKMKNSYSGYSIFSKVPSDRVRKFFYYYWQAIDSNKDYLPTTYPYEIAGDIKDPSSWKFLGKEHTEKGVGEDVDFPIYQYGTNMLDTILASDSQVLLAPGFDKPQNSQDGSWASGPLSCIRLPVKPDQEALRLSIEGYPFLVNGKLDQQQMNIYLDGEKIASANASSKMNFVIPSSSAEKFSSDNQFLICFEFPDAKSPLSFGMNQDYRDLGYHFNYISMEPYEGLQLPVMLSFKKGRTDQRIGLDGWSSPENNFTWTDGKKAFLDLPIEKTDKDIVFEFFVTPFTGNGQINGQPVTVIVNDSKVTDLQVDHKGIYSVTIPSRLLNGGLHFELDIPNAASPLSLGINQDQRTLGLAVEWVKLQYAINDAN